MLKSFFALFISLMLMGFAQVSASVLNDLMPRPKVVRDASTEMWQFDPQAIKQCVAGEAIAKLVAKGKEAYGLIITPSGVEWYGNERYAMVTLRQLAALGDGKIPCCTIEDWPTLPYRGMLHDTGRNWQPLSQLKMQLDWLEKYKFNCFQWHITDNHGWRLQSEKYPELSHPQNLDRTDHYYTQAEFKALIAYAKARGITVIPELDVPGHSETMRRAFGVKKMSEPKMRGIISELFDELLTLLDPEVTPFIHIGSDEVKPHEQVPGEWIVGWVNQIEAKGFKVVAWGPGQSPKGLRQPLIRQYWMGRQVRRPENEPYFDSQSSYYINHVDPLELLAAAAYQKPCLTGPKENHLGAIFAVWHDDAVAKPEDILTMNPAFPAMVLYSDSFWNGREKDQMRYIGNLPPPDDPEFSLAMELERRTLAQKPFFKGLPFDFYKQTQMRWRMAETAETKPFNELPWSQRIIAQGTIYPQHFFYAQTNLTNGKSGCVWLGTVVNSDADRTVEMIADCMNYSRSDGRTRDVALVPGKWNGKGAEIYLNGKPVPPPQWKQPGLQGRGTIEKPLVDEPWMVREPVRVQLKKGRNELLIKLPRKGWKWSATCFFPNDEGLSFEAPELK